MSSRNSALDPKRLSQSWQSVASRIDHTRLIENLDKSGYFDHHQAKTPDECLEDGIEKVTEVVAQAIENEL